MVVITRVRKKRKKKMVDDLEEGKIAILKICSNLLYIYHYTNFKYYIIILTLYIVLYLYLYRF